MKIKIDDMNIDFPYKKISKSQLQFIKEIKKIFENKSINLIELPIGLSKTICLFTVYLSQILHAYQNNSHTNPQTRNRLILVVKKTYDIEKKTSILKEAYNHIIRPHANIEFFGIGYTSKKNLCINPKATKYSKGEDIANACSLLISKRGGCVYYDELLLTKEKLEYGVFTLNEINAKGKSGNFCPFYMTSIYLEKADVIICNYSQIFDIDNEARLPDHIIKNSLLVLYDSENLDEVILDYNSSRINQFTLELAIKGLERLNNEVKVLKAKNEENNAASKSAQLSEYKLEYQKILRGFTALELEHGCARNKIKEVSVPYKANNGGTLTLKHTQSHIPFPQQFIPTLNSIKRAGSHSGIWTNLNTIHDSQKLLDGQFKPKNESMNYNGKNHQLGNSFADKHNSMEIEPIKNKSTLKVIDTEEEGKLMVPGNIRRAEHFLTYIKKFVYFIMKTYLPKTEPVVRKIQEFIHEFNKFGSLYEEPDAIPFSFLKARLFSLIQVCNIPIEEQTLDEILALQNITQFCYYLNQGSSNHLLLLEPYNEISTGDQLNPTLVLTALDPSDAITNLIKLTFSLLLISESLVQPELYMDILGLHQQPQGNFNFISLADQNTKITSKVERIYPLIVNRGVDQMDVSTEMTKVNDAGVLRNYGHMIADLAAFAPDIIICLFPSYKYMEDAVASWDAMDILDDIIKNKLIFIESRNPEETSITLAAFKKACETGRGGVLFALARGKIQDGLNLPKKSGKTIIMFGVPLMYHNSRVLLTRVKQIKDRIDKPNLHESEIVTFDGLRYTAHCLGNFFKSREDYGIIILADRRYINSEKVERLPKWIKNFLTEKDKKGISSDMVRHYANIFFREAGDIDFNNE